MFRNGNMDANPFTFERPQPGQLVITITQPKFDAASASEFKQRLDSTWQDTDANVAIDLGNVQFIDSSGVGALLSVQRRLPSTAEPVVLRNARPNVVSVIELLRLHRVFKVEA